MLNRRLSRSVGQRGTSLIEVLVTLVILAVGLLGVAGLQGKISVAEMESFQRSQAVLALTDMTERIRANRALAASYVTASTLGTGDSQPPDCTTITVFPDRDWCEWSNALKGAGEQNSTGKVGGMVSARGCITQLQAANPAPGTCTPGVYQVTVAWQGMSQVNSSALACGFGQYGNARHAIAASVTVGTTSCQ